ncbi:MAG: Ger(x)C family spore germination protein [Clostridia bacterium]|nr:Ger(x)C family spore germination protein [Clostridia bacterium]
MRIKKSLILFLLIMFLLPQAACYNYREVNQFSIVAGAAIDKGKDGRYLMTIEIINMKLSGKESTMESKLILTEGKTVFEAIRNAINHAAPRLYWSDCAMFIFSEEVAKEGILQAIDFIYRDSEPRTDMYMLVSQMPTAAEILKAEAKTGSIKAYEIKNMVEDEKYVSKTPRVMVYEFYNALAAKGISPVAGAVDIDKTNGDASFRLNGTAIFNGEKLAGFLTQEETFYFLYATNKIKTGVIPLNYSHKADHDDMSFEIFETKTSVKPVVSSGKLEMNINIRTEVNLNENRTTVNYLEEDKLAEVLKKLEEEVRANVEDVIKLVQMKWGLDIFGFGGRVQSDLPEVWKKVSKNWKTEFQALKTNVKVQMVLRNPAQVQKPLKVSDD